MANDGVGRAIDALTSLFEKKEPKEPKGPSYFWITVFLVAVVMATFAFCEQTKRKREKSVKPECPVGYVLKEKDSGWICREAK